MAQQYINEIEASMMSDNLGLGHTQVVFLSIEDINYYTLTLQLDITKEELKILKMTYASIDSTVHASYIIQFIKQAQHLEKRLKNVAKILPDYKDNPRVANLGMLQKSFANLICAICSIPSDDMQVKMTEKCVVFTFTSQQGNNIFSIAGSFGSVKVPAAVAPGAPRKQKLPFELQHSNLYDEDAEQDSIARRIEFTDTVPYSLEHGSPEWVRVEVQPEDETKK